MASKSIVISPEIDSDEIGYCEIVTNVVYLEAREADDMKLLEIKAKPLQ